MVLEEFDFSHIQVNVLTSFPRFVFGEDQDFDVYPASETGITTEIVLSSMIRNVHLPLVGDFWRASMQTLY